MRVVVQDAGEARLEEAMLNRRMQYIDKHVFLHRLYVSLNTQFATNQVCFFLFFSLLVSTLYKHAHTHTHT